MMVSKEIGHLIGDRSSVDWVARLLATVFRESEAQDNQILIVLHGGTHHPSWKGIGRTVQRWILKPQHEHG